MENVTLIPDDYNELLNQYKGLKKELNSARQTICDTTRQVKVNEALLDEYISDIELLQKREESQNEKHEAKVAGLQEIIAALRSNHADAVSEIETELEKKERENDQLKSELEILKKKNIVEAAIDVSTNLNEIIALTNNNEILQEKVQQIEEAFAHLQNQYSKLQETFEDCKEELSQVKENLKLKRDELSENAILIDKLNDELMCAQRELENYRQKPLEANSKGNSLFAEVDDRRLTLQKTVNHMKPSYIRLQQEHAQLVKSTSQLRKENADLRESWKKDLEEIQEDKYWVNDTLKRHAKVLEELLDDQKKQLEDQSMLTSSDLPRDFKFYHQMIDDKCKEVDQWKKKYSDKSINEHLMSVNLAEANKKVRLLRIEVQKQADELNEHKSQHDARETVKDEVLHCHKCSSGKEAQRKIDSRRATFTVPNSMPIKGCLKPNETIPEGDLLTPESELTMVFNNAGVKEGDFVIPNTRNTVANRRKLQSFDDSVTDDTKEAVKTEIDSNATEDLISFVDKENVDLNIVPTNAKEKREVTFSDNTVDPVGNPAQRRGTRVFVMKKKNDGIA